MKYLDLKTDGVGYACGLTDKGVAEYGGRTLDEHSRRTLDHELEITDYLIGVEEFCQHNGLLFQFTRPTITHGISPDAYFVITDPKKETKHTLPFFYEKERAKLGGYEDGQPSVIAKLKRYYDYYNTAECEKTWGFKTFRVIISQETADRRKNLLARMQDGLRHRMFLLTIKNSVGDMQTPKGDTFTFLDLWN